MPSGKKQFVYRCRRIDTHFTGSVEEKDVLSQSLLRDSKGTEDARHSDTGRSLNVIVECTIEMTILLQESKSVMILKCSLDEMNLRVVRHFTHGEIFKLNQTLLTEPNQIIDHVFEVNLTILTDRWTTARMNSSINSS